MREIILDTETTGFDPFSGDRIVEIGCVEIENLVPTGETFHRYVNPERDVPEPAFKIHGLNREFLSTHPVFEALADEFLEFIGDDNFVAHNAVFDLRFLNWELENVGRAPIASGRAIDTLAIARQKFPGAQNSLDALCRRFEIDNSHRQLHGALLDSEILAEVYLELRGGRQTGLQLDATTSAGAAAIANTGTSDDPTGIDATDQAGQTERPVRAFPASPEELARHNRFIEKMTDPVWRR